VQTYGYDDVRKRVAMMMDGGLDWAVYSGLLNREKRPGVGAILAVGRDIIVQPSAEAAVSMFDCGCDSLSASE